MSFSLNSATDWSLNSPQLQFFLNSPFSSLYVPETDSYECSSLTHICASTVPFLYICLQVNHTSSSPHVLSENNFGPSVWGGGRKTSQSKMLFPDHDKQPEWDPLSCHIFKNLIRYLWPHKTDSKQQPGKNLSVHHDIGRRRRRRRRRRRSSCLLPPDWKLIINDD